jgi:hypothetical protein
MIEEQGAGSRGYLHPSGSLPTSFVKAKRRNGQNHKGGNREHRKRVAQILPHYIAVGVIIVGGLRAVFANLPPSQREGVANRNDNFRQLGLLARS